MSTEVKESVSRRSRRAMGPQVTDPMAPIQWKLPITFAIATIISVFLAFSATGETRFILARPTDFVTIPAFTVPAALSCWILVAVMVVGTVLATQLARARRKIGVVIPVVVGFSFILTFFLFLGGGSSGAITLTQVLLNTVALSTPIIFGSMAGVVCERVGVINIAIEGQLLLGAFCAVLVASATHQPYLGLIAACLGGAFVGVLLALFAVRYWVDQIIVGVVLNVLIAGLTSFFYETLLKPKPELNLGFEYRLSAIAVPGLSKIPVIGPVLFNHNLLVYLMYLAVIVLTIMLFHSRWGLRLRACGEHPRAADTVGIKVNRTRWLNVILGSSLAGLGGAYFTICTGIGFEKDMSAGNGYIGLAAMIIGKWHPAGAFAAALLFGLAKSVAILVPSVTSNVPPDLLNMIPYAVTILAVAGFVGRVRPPAAENIPYKN